MRLRSAIACVQIASLFFTCPAFTQETGQTDTLRVTSRLVIVDVSVTDKKGAPVHGLTAADFELRENNTVQRIGNCEEHALTLTPAPQVAESAKNSHHFETPGPGQQLPTPTLILLDLLNTSIQDQGLMRASILEFLKKQPAGAQIAIFGLATRLYPLQSFTSDPVLLRRAIAANGKDARRSAVNNNKVASDPTGASAANAMQEFAIASQNPAVDEAAYELNQFEGYVAAGENAAKLEQTMLALRQIAAYLSPLPGKKNLVWFSPGTPFSTLPDPSMQHPYDAVVDASGPLERVTALMAKGRIAVYTIDPRASTFSPVYTAAYGGRSEDQRARITQQLTNETTMQHHAVGEIAQKTGGTAYYNTNDLSGAVSRIVELGSNYYSISYSPSDPKWDGHFRKVQLALKQKGYHLAYRDGYFAADAAAPIEDGKPNIGGVMKGAMLYGTPSRGDLPFAVDVDLAAQNETSPDPKTEFPPSVKGPYRRYRLDYRIDPHQVLFAEHTPGIHEGTVKFLLLVYDQKGTVVASTNNMLVGKLPAKSYDRLLDTGIRLHQEISVPQKGFFTARLAVEDMANGHVGAIEVPLDVP